MIGQHSVTLTPPGGTALDISCLVDQVSIRQGRDDTDSQPDAASCTLDLSVDTELEPLPAVLDMGGLIEVRTTLAGVDYVRFHGTVTDMSQGWIAAGDDTPDMVTAQVIATGPLADLGRRTVGDEPWPQQLDGARQVAILSAAGVTLDPLYSDPGTVQILPRDVDSQPALGLAQDVALDAGGVLWVTRAGEIRYADAQHRRGVTPVLALDACDVLVTPTWRRTTEGLINAVSIGYGIASSGSEQPRYTAEAPASIAKYGDHGLSVATQLADAADAQAMGSLLLAANQNPVWVLGALPLAVKDLSTAETQTLLSLEMHDLISVTGMPAAGSVPTSTALWVEGWSETLTWGDHTLELVVSGYCRTVPPPRWNDVNPSATWDSMGSVTWDSAVCLGPQIDLGRWDDVPATTRWDQLDPATTWDTYAPIAS